MYSLFFLLRGKAGDQSGGLLSLSNFRHAQFWLGHLETRPMTLAVFVGGLDWRARPSHVGPFK
jgi:hypothetical protein